MQIASDYQAAAQTTQNLQQRLATDIQSVEATNAGIDEVNRRVLPVLGMITGQDLGVDPEKWKTWWTDQLGYVYESNIPDQQAHVHRLDHRDPLHGRHDPHGVLLGRDAGPHDRRPARDRVDPGRRPRAGAGPDDRPAHLPPGRRGAPQPPGGDAADRRRRRDVVATGIHRFWQAGKGWTMARDLKPGDRLRVLGGTAEVRSIKPDDQQPVYNLDVADDRDFFVGTKGLLVHDFSFVQPVLAPFDREPDLTSPAAAPPSSMLGPKAP